MPRWSREPTTAWRSRDATDEAGTALEAPADATFTTEESTEPFTPALAFVRLAQPAIEGVTGPPAIYLATVDGSRVQRLTDGEGPAWSPDGGRIAFVRGNQLRLIEADGSGERLLASGGTAGWAPGSPSWSPDGTRLLFEVGYGDGLSGDVFVLDVSPSGSPLKLIGTGHPNTSYAPVPAWPRWSPDGRHITLVSIPLGWVESPVLGVMDADGSNFQPLVPSWPPCQGVEWCEYMAGPIVEDYAWSPDGSRLVAPYRLYYPPTLTIEVAMPPRWCPSTRRARTSVSSSPNRGKTTGPTSSIPPFRLMDAASPSPSTYWMAAAHRRPVP